VRKLIALIAGTAFSAALYPLAAQSDGNLEDTMKQVMATMGKLKKGLDAKSLHDAAGDAEKMQGLFKDAEAIFAGLNIADAVQMAKTAQSAAGEIVNAGHSDNAEGASAAFSKLGGTCKGCHDAHREKLPDGKYKLKQ
jgi:cytochrome c556